MNRRELMKLGLAAGAAALVPLAGAACAAPAIGRWPGCTWCNRCQRGVSYDRITVLPPRDGYYEAAVRCYCDESPITARIPIEGYSPRRVFGFNYDEDRPRIPCAKCDFFVDMEYDLAMTSCSQRTVVSCHGEWGTIRRTFPMMIMIHHYVGGAAVTPLYAHDVYRGFEVPKAFDPGYKAWKRIPTPEFRELFQNV